MVGTHGADIDGFETTYPTIILDLYTRKIPDGICHTKGIHLFKLYTCKCLRDNYILLLDAGGYGVLIEIDVTCDETI